MARIIAATANKGGVGKTSIITNLAGAITTKHRKYKVLIIDTDSQGNASTAFNINAAALDYSLYDALTNEETIERTIQHVFERIDLLPANQDMAAWEIKILRSLKEQSPFSFLSPIINSLRNHYDYILIDTPPSLGLTTGNVLAAVEEIIIPFTPETFAVQGLIRVIEILKDFQKDINPNLKLSGIIGMMVDQRTTLHSEMLQEARKYSSINSLPMLETIIPRSIRFANSTAYQGKPATLTDRNNPIVTAYFDLLNELEGDEL